MVRSREGRHTRRYGIKESCQVKTLFSCHTLRQGGQCEQSAPRFRSHRTRPVQYRQRDPQEASWKAGCWRGPRARPSS
ncbi:hypothetical protein SKAU_G00027960 [Synaphobranchus kaupii]|uniref:Uncharacterized protein n=1 Tax=Synaphobranchus kaupii TaxID=118154 RepID=A0A9Q1JDT1_SYNKA|nr:hypothetical protein SKAU_G00027960 [Synaphobranchus kaupii]